MQCGAIFEKKSSGDAMHYVHTDHLGSLNCLTSQSSAIEQEISYDAWGNRRDPATLQNYTTAPTGLITDRGFTGHEHMEAFKLINMNGRIYDPLLGRFLSADITVANGASTQDYNRFSYVLNNPLSFTDPSGYYLNQYSNTKSSSSWVYQMYEGGDGNGGGGFSYNWWSGTYSNSSGEIVSFNEVNSNYILPNSTPPTSENMRQLGINVIFQSYVNNVQSNSGAYTGIGFTSEKTNRIYRVFEMGGKVFATFSSTNYGTQNGEGGEHGFILPITKFTIEASEHAVSNENFWISTKNWGIYSAKWGGNGATGGRSVSTAISGKIGVLGKIAGAYVLYNVAADRINGKTDNVDAIADGASGLIGIFGGIYGAAWSFGWEMGREYGPSKWFATDKIQESQIMPLMRKKYGW